MGVHSQNEYRTGTAFSLSEMSSQGQITMYNRILGEKLDLTLEQIFHNVLSIEFPRIYNFTNNIRFSPSSICNTYLEKIRHLAPEFESILKQFKLFVEESEIDHELLQMSSSPFRNKGYSKSN